MRLAQNPFHLLGAGLEWDRQRIAERAQTLELDGCDFDARRVRREVTTPRTRLKAEIAWLPCVSDEDAQALMRALQDAPLSLLRGQGSLKQLNGLAKVNVLCSIIQQAGAAMPSQELGFWLATLSDETDALDPARIMEDINAARQSGGMAASAPINAVQNELAEHRNALARDAVSLLGNLVPREAGVALALAVDYSTDQGQKPGANLLYRMLDGYEAKLSGDLQQLGERVEQGIAKTFGTIKAGAGNKAVTREIAATLESLDAWDELAQPLQMGRQSRGQKHEESVEMAIKVRDFAIELVNRYHLVDEACKVIHAACRVFAEVEQMTERLREDLEDLTNLSAKLKERRDGVQKQASASGRIRDVAIRCSAAVASLAFFWWIYTSEFEGEETDGAESSYGETGKRQEENLNPTYIKPDERSAGRILSVQEIQWCLANGLMIDAVRSSTYSYRRSDSDVSLFNRWVADHNGRCGHYQYYGNNKDRAERTVSKDAARLRQAALSYWLKSEYKWTFPDPQLI